MLRFLRTEPALIMGLVTTLLGLLMSAGIHLSTDKTGVIEAVVSAALGLIVAAATWPFAVGAVTGLIGAVGTLLLTFGVHHVSAGEVSAVNAFVVAILAVIMRMHITPVASLRAAPKLRAPAAM